MAVCPRSLDVSVLQSVKDWLRINAQPNGGDNQSADCYARKAVYRNGVGLGIRLPIHRAHNLEIIIESAPHRDHSNDHECDLTLQNCCVKDVELAEKSCRERHTCKRNHPDQHRECEKWRTFCEPIEIGNLFAGLLRDNCEHCETQQGHQQVSDEVEGNRADIKTDHADKQIAC